MQIEVEYNKSSKSVLVSWRFTKEFIENNKLTSNNKILIVTKPNNLSSGSKYCSFNEMKTIVNVQDGSTYINFKHPGNNIVAVFLLKDNTIIEQPSYKYWLSSESNTVYISSVEGHIEYNTVLSETDSIICNHTTIDVPQEIFAKPLSKLDKFISGVWYGYRDPNNSCEAYKRRILFYIFGPIFLFVMFCVITIVIMGIVLLEILKFVLYIFMCICSLLTLSKVDYKVFYRQIKTIINTIKSKDIDILYNYEYESSLPNTLLTNERYSDFTNFILTFVPIFIVASILLVICSGTSVFILGFAALLMLLCFTSVVGIIRANYNFNYNPNKIKLKKKEKLNISNLSIDNTKIKTSFSYNSLKNRFCRRYQ